MPNKHVARGRLKASQLHQALHRICNREARLRHRLPCLLGHFWQCLHFTQFVRMVIQLAQDLFALPGRGWRQIVFTYSNNAGDNRYDLGEVLV